MADPEMSEQQQEEMLRKKYGGVLPKKKNLLSKGHERAYFDSAEWALKKGQQAKGGEKKEPEKKEVPCGDGLQPKLEPTPLQHSGSMRKSSLAVPDEKNII